MVRHILVPTDGSKRSEAAIKSGVKLAKALGAKITGVHVIPPFHQFTYRAQMLLSYHAALAEDSESAYNEATVAQAGRILQVVSQTAAKAGVGCDTIHISHDLPFKAILEVAKKKGCDLILMASHGHGGVSGLLLGSETQKVLTHSTIPVLVYR